MNQLTTIAALVTAISLAGCMSDKEKAEYARQSSQQRATIQLPTEKPNNFVQQKAPEPPPERFEVVRVQVITDYLAYNNTRAVYILKDRKTGQEFVGLSGVGITELNRVTCGKGCSKEVEQ